MPTITTARGASSTIPSTHSSVLRSGANGTQVSALQRALRAHGLVIPVDGDFGPRTLAAVKAFQRRAGVPVDGVAGPKTFAALRSSTAPSSRADAAGAPRPTSAGPTRVANAYRNGRATTVRLAPVGNGQYLAVEAAGKYKQMLAAARAAGVSLSSTSGFRTHAQQAALFRRYGAGRAARPGYSNHQQGLSMDIGGVRSYGTRAYKWLQANAGRFGFVNDVRGEYWHWTYRR